MSVSTINAERAGRSLIPATLFDQALASLIAAVSATQPLVEIGWHTCILYLAAALTTRLAAGGGSGAGQAQQGAA
ncbi:hypothetical protein M1L60_24790 [Actinoplanes sp. TRM 88003]|uniref:Uncharacterized protein n=1 Tax=Paractinoplanes aksuensis TaxID=2939490 RepID=A0ABT1DV29_9ACTN|nr:hypothetical protein [Actinoplanes aksuensis]MCO8273820.1 hypothetical protein [Actinoplanes aksuensis]